MQFVVQAIYIVVQKIEAKLCANKDFNPHSRSRRSYQLPTDRDENGRFVLSAALFVKKNAFNRSKNITLPYTPHKWLTDALKDSGRWMLNPDRPRLLVFKNGALANLADDGEPVLIPGDVIWASFTLTFSIGSVYWAPEYRPIELIRVGRLSRPQEFRTGIETLDIIDNERRPLEVGTKLELPNCQLSIDAVIY